MDYTTCFCMCVFIKTTWTEDEQQYDAKESR